MAGDSILCPKLSVPGNLIRNIPSAAADWFAGYVSVVFLRFQKMDGWAEVKPAR